MDANFQQLMQQMMMQNNAMMQQMAALMNGGVPTAAPIGLPIATVPTVTAPEKPKRPPVKLVVNPDTKAAVTPYQNKSEYGYILVEEAQVQQRSLSWIGKVRRTALLKGDVESLKIWVTDTVKGGKLPGQIVVKEYARPDVPLEYYREFIGEDRDDQEAAERPFIKYSGKDGVPLTIEGEDIFRFSFYDQYYEMEDLKVVHDNGIEVAAKTKENRALVQLKMQEELAEKQRLADAEAAAKLASTTVKPVVATVDTTVEAALPDNGDKKK